MQVMQRMMLIVVMIFAAPVVSSTAGETDLLIEKMVQKGLLTPVEAKIIQSRTNAYVAKEMIEGRSKVMPQWIQSTKLKGDLRLRYQDEKDKRPNYDERKRARLRYRLGIENRINQKLKVGIGLASGGADPRSTNATFDNSFDSLDIALDYAYAEVSPADWISMIAGKYDAKEYLWFPTDMIWDSDLRPEGLSMHNEFALTRQTDVFLNSGYWIIDESLGQRGDPSMKYVQSGLAFDNDSVDWTIAATWLMFDGVQGIRLDHTSCSNSGLSGEADFCFGTLTVEYDVVHYAAELGFSYQDSMEKTKRLGLFGEQVTNRSADSNDTAWSAGVVWGHDKVRDWAEWQLKYQYTYLEKDATLDIFPDSDRYEGLTDVEGKELSLRYGLAQNVFIDLDFYQSDRIKADQNRKQVLQADLNVVF